MQKAFWKGVGNLVWLALSLTATLVVTNPAKAFPTNDVVAGPLYSNFRLTLDEGWREEAIGPLFYAQQTDSQLQIACPPLWCWTHTTNVDWKEFDFLYPLLTYRKFGVEHGWQFAQVISFGAGENQADTKSRRFTLFPFYFQSRSTDTNTDYTAVLPFYGTLRNRLFHDYIHFVMFPAYSHTIKHGIVTDNYLFPFVDKHHGENLTGWQFWPFYGVEHKGLTFKTDTVGESHPVGGHDRYFVLFPFYINNRQDLETTNAQTNLTIIPFYNVSHSTNREMVCYGWPLGYNVIHDHVRGYDERDVFWPLYVFAHGTKEERRIFPFYSRARTEDLESDWVMWPVYKFNRLHSPPLERTRTRIFFFLYSDTRETNTANGALKRRVDFWPFYTFHRDPDGEQRLQVMALIEPLFPNNRTIIREYSQIWSFWRAEKNPKTGASSQSLLWNLYRHEQTPDSSKTSFFFGLIQHEKKLNRSK